MSTSGRWVTRAQPREVVPGETRVAAADASRDGGWARLASTADLSGGLVLVLVLVFLVFLASTLASFSPALSSNLFRTSRSRLAQHGRVHRDAERGASALSARRMRASWLPDPTGRRAETGGASSCPPARSPRWPWWTAARRSTGSAPRRTRAPRRSRRPGAPSSASRRGRRGWARRGANAADARHGRGLGRHPGDVHDAPRPEVTRANAEAFARSVDSVSAPPAS